MPGTLAKIIDTHCTYCCNTCLVLVYHAAIGEYRCQCTFFTRQVSLDRSVSPFSIIYKIYQPMTSMDSRNPFNREVFTCQYRCCCCCCCCCCPWNCEMHMTKLYQTHFIRKQLVVCTLIQICQVLLLHWFGHCLNSFKNASFFFWKFGMQIIQ